METYVVWETWLTPGGSEQGLVITKKIWVDMLSFDGYLGHLLLHDEDDAGHVILVSLWESRQAADRAKELYADHPNVKALQPLLQKERARTVCSLEEINGTLV